MKFYHEASKIVKPKLEALAIAEGQMDAANKVTQPREEVSAGFNLSGGPDRASNRFRVLFFMARGALV